MGGGNARVYPYSNLDSLIWSLPRVPAVERALGFDSDDGAVSVIDADGQPRRIDMRASAVRLASRARLSSLSSVTGSDIFGVDSSGRVVRLSPEGDWTFEPPSPARWVFPQPNGSLIVAGNQGSETHLWLIRPTGDEILHATTLPTITRGVRTPVGDRLYFTVGSGMMGVLTRDLSAVKPVAFDAPVVAVAPTPSGDRLYVALRGENGIAVIDRYTESVSARVGLPGPAEDLRMDRLGQNLLARPASDGDSAWVIAVATNRLLGSIRTSWRNDLPVFTPEGAIATVRDDDVVIVGSSDLRDLRVIVGGAADFWYFFAWNGFRPRASDLDRPVTFESQLPVSPGDSMRLEGDSVPLPSLRDAAPSMVNPPRQVAPRAQAYMVSFAAVLTRERAAEVAAGIVVNGARARVIAAASGPTTIYRVVLGPYATRDEADRVGRESQRQYWVFEEPR